MIKILTATFIILLASISAQANTDMANTEASAIPDALKPWSGWVLRDIPEATCPHLYNANENFCAYPSRLELTLNAVGGRFTQSWAVYAKSWIVLPGDAMQWPKQVTVNDKAMAVISRNQQPALQLDAGQYTIKGQFSWPQLPKSLSLPADTGLVYVSLNGETIPQPDIRQGQLWLSSSQTQKHENNRLSLNVFRKINDSQPLQITTMIEMDVAGLQREISLDGALLEGFKVSGLTSHLPARIDQNGQLRLQLRPGHWEVYIDSQFNAASTGIELKAFASPWPEQEIWVLEHQPHLRQIQVQGRSTIDPQQTRLPGAWKQFPSYNMNSGESLQWTVIKRGDPEPEPDQLSLKKNLWLDFSGDAYTVKDEISGTLSRHWRLNATKDVSLGQVMIDGQPQTITRLQGEEVDGVEMRQGNVNLIADSRVTDIDGTLSATGWQSQFNKVNATLHLPMGYQLFSLAGADAPQAWLNRWSLLDLFLVLITAMACYRLWGIGWGLVALATLSLSWHELNAPQMIWLNLIITIAIIKMLSAGRLLKALTLYRNLVMLLLILSSLIFIIDQARTAIYPQLEPYDYAPPQMRHQPVAESDEFTLQERARPTAAMQSKSYKDSYLSSAPTSVMKQKKPQVIMVDPDAMIQTGPGLPNWHWHSYAIQWDGPVQMNQNIELTIVSPAVHRTLNVLRILLVVLLIWRLFDQATGNWKNLASYLPARAISTALLLPLAFIFYSGDSHAEYPSKELLDELQQHLLKPAECLPQCANIESLTIQLAGDSLTLTAKAHATEDVAFPLPVPINRWVPSSVMVDLKQAESLFRKADQSLWLLMKKGVHTLEMKGSVTHLSELKIDFQLKPQHIRYDLNGWSAEITGEQIKQSQSLGFHRIASNEKSAETLMMNNDIPLFAEVSRYIELGLDWSVTTEVQLISGNALPGVLRVPLLAGESVITDGITVKDNAAVITLNKTTQSIRWHSTLPKSDTLTLTASTTSDFNEIWQLNSSAMWHISYEGIPVIYHQRQGRHWQPEWHPWPGESVSINISRPQGVKGNTKTIDDSQLTLTPGESLTTAKLSFNLRSSLGGQHDIHIPADSELMSVKINDENIPVRLSEGSISLPIIPGAQNVVIDWREPRGISAGVFKTTEVDLGAASVNAKISLNPGMQRWVLFAGGPTLGPAVLFWGVFFVIIGIAIGLSRISDMPLSVSQWILLGIGLSASAPAAGLLIVIWLLALRTRAKRPAIESANFFNLYQLLLLALTFAALTSLFFVIQQGLLGSPDMQITGNDSSRYLLNWYTDRSDATLPSAWIITVPMLVYRSLMLLWAIWLAFALLNWLRWGWNCYVTHGYWCELPSKKKKATSDEKVK